jgi:hypothetical protein
MTKMKKAISDSIIGDIKRSYIVSILLSMSVCVSGCGGPSVKMPLKYDRVTCPPISVVSAKWGGGFAQKPETAAKIGESIIFDIKSQKEINEIKEILVKDEGAVWGVYSINKLRHYGGGVGMKIGKCTADVSNIVFSE